MITAVLSAPGRLRRGFAWTRGTRTAVGAAGVSWALGLTTGLLSGAVFPIAAMAPDHQPWHLFWPILTTNLVVALGMVGGVVTLGTASLAGTFVVGAYTGATWHACWYATGLAATLDRLVPFFLFEFAGLFCATVAGLLPISESFTAGRVPGSRRGPEAWLVRYLAGMRRALPWVVTSAGLLVIAAILEILQGVPR